MIKSFTAKIGNMRKPQEFVTYPRKDVNDPITVQSDRTIGRFDPTTGVGMLNTRGSGHKGFMHLSPILGAEAFTFPEDFRRAAIEAGSVTPCGTVQVIG